MKNKAEINDILLNFKPTWKQHLLWMLLKDHETTQILWGGSGGCGKSFIGCCWLLFSCIEYPETRWLMGRARLKSLHDSTFKTFKEVSKRYGFDSLWTFNGMQNTITFTNGSEILLYDLYDYPADPQYDRLGSVELTGAFLDELSQISKTGFDVVNSRIRYKLDEYNLHPKVLCASNPYQGWVKNYFYLPWKQGLELDYVKFLPALVTDNPYASKPYIDNLHRLDNALKQRLLYGNWDYDDSQYSLFDYDSLRQCFYNDFFANTDQKTYITADIADMGGDSTVICVWKGWICFKKVILKQKNTVQIVDEINKLRNEHKVLINNIIIDATGVGAGCAALLNGCIRYMAGSKALNNEGYRNIKTQLMYKFAEKINNQEVYLNFKYEDEIVQEFLLYKKEFNDNTASITSKSEIKSKLGKSPDTIDSLYLRAYFEFKKTGGTIVRVI